MTTANRVISRAEKSNAKNLAPKKETVGTWSLVAVTPSTNQLAEIITARTYMARSADGAGPVYASVWIRSPGFHTSGHGRANGYGYHKPSAAIQDALDSAGFKLERAIDGCGSEAIKDAFATIAWDLGYSQFIIVTH